MAEQETEPAAEPVVNPRRVPPWKRKPPQAKLKRKIRDTDSRPDKFKQKMFLRAVAQIGPYVVNAAKVAKVNYRRHSHWMERDPDYPAKFAAAAEQALDQMEAKAHELAMAGSERMIMFMLNGGRSWKYKYRQEITGANGGPLQLAAVVVPLAVQQILANPLAVGQELTLDERLLGDTADRPAIAGDAGPLRQDDNGRAVLVPAACTTISANGAAVADGPNLQPDHCGGASSTRQK